MYIYFGSFFFHVAEVVVLSCATKNIDHYYLQDPVIFQACLFGVWVLSDFAPIVYLFKVHHNNFISFEGQEVLETEGDAQSEFTGERLSLFKSSQGGLARMDNTISTGYIFD